MLVEGSTEEVKSGIHCIPNKFNIPILLENWDDTHDSNLIKMGKIPGER